MELAQQFGISVATVKRHKKALGLGSNCERNNRGTLGERLVAEYLTQHGVEVVTTRHSAAVDLWADKLRVEVKVMTPRKGGAAQVRLPALRGSNYNQYQYGKDYERDADILALAVLSGEALSHLYLLPSAYWKPTITVHPDSSFCPFRPFLNWLGWLPTQSQAV
ncbi:hypothetical protein [Deinococcus arenicola]|uniref:PD(D/E)XK endonuclease domain-containing protein n=1 Tax=Deinococcus arenicola TaxID=2994950 RepID=A0ABU4DMK8_9DEIO|nr:hypothetical protein [Deinococcus sp. ZS9-10]MDV6373674.1 hypothetical protein [Deinococcus sp. ZS9-10]